MDSSLSYLLIACLVHLIRRSTGTKIDNDVLGDPQVSCTEDSVTFSVRSTRPFTGNIFIKGKYTVPQCRQEYFSNSFNGASFTVRIGQCGMRRIRQLQPHGMNYILVFVVNFHNQFITKVDRAYNVRCFYAQVDKTVTSQLGVSMILTTELQAQTVVMPNCIYTVRSGTLNGPEVRFVRVGDRLVHRWECDNPNFGMLVKNCFVNDGQGSSVRVLDSRGCPVFTPVIQGLLNYDNSLNLAYVDVWAYKFPDRSQLFFQCQIQVCNKRENECVGVTPPNCPRIALPNTAGGINVGIQGGTGIIGQGGYVGTGSVGVPQPIPSIGINQGLNQYGINQGINQGLGINQGIGINRINQGIGINQAYNQYNTPGLGINQPIGSTGYQYGINQGVIGNRPYAAQRRRKDEETDPEKSSSLEAGKQRVPVTIEEKPAIDVSEFLKPDHDERTQFLPGIRPGPIQKQVDAETETKTKSRRALSAGDQPLPPPVKAEDNTMDVASETVFIVDLEQGSEAEEEAEKFAHLMNHDGLDDLVCLNPASIGFLAACFLFMFITIIGLLILICRRSKGDRGITEDKDSSNSAVESWLSSENLISGPLRKLKRRFVS